MLEPITTGWHGAQLWCCNLDNPQVLSNCDESFLDSDELQRAQRLHSPRQRQLLIRRRALRRFLLGQFLETPPQEICFAENDYGKPRLSSPALARCEFSTSHSENVFAMAIAEESEIGVDVEVLQPDWDLKSVATMYLEQEQLRQLEKLPQLEQQKQFLRFWSLREAFAKASGDGIVQLPDGQISAEQVWDCAGDADLRLPDWNWSQHQLRIGGQEAVISLAQQNAAFACLAIELQMPQIR